MSSEASKAEFVLRRLVRSAGLQLLEDCGVAAIRTGLMTGEPEGFAFRVHNGVAGAGMKFARGFVPLEAIRRGGDTLVEAVNLALSIAAAELGVRPMSMVHTGTFRIHFNRHGAAPLVWCVATDEWELAIATVTVAGAELRTVYRAKATPDHEDGKPSAWLEVTGVLTVAGAEARITRGAPA